MTEVQLQFHRGGAEFFTTEARRHTEEVKVWSSGDTLLWLPDGFRIRRTETR